MTTINGFAPARMAAQRTSQQDAPTPDTPKDDGGGLSTGAKVGIGAGIGVGVLAAGAAGVALLASRGHIELPFGGQTSRVIGAIDGVELLSNPRLPKDTKAHWGVPSSGSLFGTSPRVSIEHVDQGALGDCWNIAGMGAIAEVRPERIEQIVRHASDGKHVIVELPGSGRKVAVTPELPLRPNGSPAFGGSDDGDAVRWPAYVEKAQATLKKGGYRALEGGIAETTFRQLLGADPRRVALPQGSVFQGARVGLDRNEPTAIASYDALSPRAEALNIKGNHMYVVRQSQAEDPAGTLRLFNPWGKEHPTRPLTQAEVDDAFQMVNTESFTAL